MVDPLPRGATLVNVGAQMISHGFVSGVKKLCGSVCSCTRDFQMCDTDEQNGCHTILGVAFAGQWKTKEKHSLRVNRSQELRSCARMEKRSCVCRRCGKLSILHSLPYRHAFLLECHVEYAVFDAMTCLSGDMSFVR